MIHLLIIMLTVLEMDFHFSCTLSENAKLHNYVLWMTNSHRNKWRGNQCITYMYDVLYGFIHLLWKQSGTYRHYWNICITVGSDMENVTYEWVIKMKDNIQTDQSWSHANQRHVQELTIRGTMNALCRSGVKCWTGVNVVIFLLVTSSHHWTIEQIWSENRKQCHLDQTGRLSLRT